ncbi:hypothetical protein LCGC14_2713730 [marine sediment metagenome]|uniref:HEPN AbiJ-N-terminal domain-containing protein n=1 Tax=marine sediment metagenome TaxID=412755 RepID=A0A0F8ZC48_9ZZZZ
MKERFSERKGLTKKKIEIIKNTLDLQMKNRLWNAFMQTIWPHFKTYGLTNMFKQFFRNLWDNFFKSPIDTIPERHDHILSIFRDIFLGDTEFYVIFDFIEYLVRNYLNNNIKNNFKDACNQILKEELSAYRIVGDSIMELTSEQEIETIDYALEVSPDYVKKHLNTAIDLMKKKTVDGYRNSIKESISAVEAICRKITNKPKIELSRALKLIDKKINFHPAFKSGLEKMYAYTSDEDGIRHSLMGNPNLNIDDAKFMLVICSAFVNYLQGKVNSEGS